MVRLVAVARAGALLVALLAASPAFAQDIVTISGTVTTAADGQPVPRAAIAIAVPTAKVTVTSDDDGHYEIIIPRMFVHNGRVDMTVDALGLPTKTVGVRVDGATARADVALTVGFAE